MQCAYFADHRCRSCALLPVPYPEQLRHKQQSARQALGPEVHWLPPVASPQQGFRNKAKMVVGGTIAAPTIGIRDAQGHGVDLRDCPICAPEIQQACAVLADFVNVAQLAPYQLAKRRGELKYLLVTVAPSGALMVRFVLRSTESVARIAKHLNYLTSALPIVVVSANILPQHVAVLEGDQEIGLTQAQLLPITLDQVTIQLAPGAFFQTNTAVAAQLYRQVQGWVDQAAPSSIWDLYCGAGGFALHCAAPGRQVIGVEINGPAIAGARAAAEQTGTAPVQFVNADALVFARSTSAPEAVIVNPPRRGIGALLAQWLETSSVRQLIYSSCHLPSLVADLGRLPSWRVRQARVFDMFPHTEHYEIVVSAERV